MRALGEVVIGLVEANVTVAANAEELQVRIAGLAHYAIVLGACLVRVGVGAVGHVRVGQVDVDLVEEVLAHEVVVALRVLVRKTTVLIQVVGANLREVAVALVVPLGQLLVGANGRGAGGKAEDAGGLEDYLGRDHIRRLAAHVPIVLGTDDSHGSPSFCKRVTSRGTRPWPSSHA